MFLANFSKGDDICVFLFDTVMPEPLKKTATL